MGHCTCDRCHERRVIREREAAVRQLRRPGPLAYLLIEEKPLWYCAFERDGRLQEIYVRTKREALHELRAAGLEPTESP